MLFRAAIPFWDCCHEDPTCSTLLTNTTGRRATPINTNSIVEDDNDDDDKPPTTITTTTSTSSPSSKRERSNALGENAENQQQDYHVDNDDLSAESIMSEDSDGSDNASIDSKYRGMERISKRFEMRDRRFGRIARGRRRSYQNMLLAHEAECRDVIVTMYHQKHSNTNDNNNQQQPRQRQLQRRRSSVTERAWYLCLFESIHTTEGLLLVIFYCSGNIAIYTVLNTYFSKAAAQMDGMNQVLLCCFVTFISIVTMRLNGYLWVWLGHDSYNLVKFEMHNRANLGFLDTKIMSSLKGTQVSMFLTILSFYGVYISVSHVYYQGLDELVLTPLDKWYVQQYETAFDSNEFLGRQPSCDSFFLLEHFYERAAGNYLCTSPDDWSNIATWFHVIVYLMSALGMYLLGSNLLVL